MALVLKNFPAKAGDVRDSSLIPRSGQSPGGGHGNPLQYSCLENPMDRGTWWATVHRITESDMSEATQHTPVKVSLREKVNRNMGPAMER